MTKKPSNPESFNLLIKKISPFADAIIDPDRPGQTFSFWLMNALSIHNKTGKTSSFAPFDAYFATQATFRQSFSTFVEAELRGQIIGTSDANQLLINVVGNVLQLAVEDIAAHRLPEPEDGFILDDFVFDMFDILFDLDSEAASEWGARAIRSQQGFSSTRTMGDTPSPIALYLRFVADDTSGVGRCNFYGALLEWCWQNSDEYEVQAHAFEILLLSLRAETEPGRAQKQLIWIERLMEPYHGLHRSILMAIDEEMVEQGIILKKDETLRWADRLLLESDPGFRYLVSTLSSGEKEIWRASQLLMFAFSKELTPSNALEDYEFGNRFGSIGSAAEACRIPIEFIKQIQKEYIHFSGQY